MLAKRVVTVPVTMKALMARINRKLKANGEILKTARSPNVETSVGRYFICDVNRNTITRQRIDPETLARELGVLPAWERVED
jgi:hypothetical protein